MIKLIVRYAFLGIACGCVILVIMGIRADLTRTGDTHVFADNFTTQAVSAMVIGIGFSVTSVVHKIERLATWLQTAIHLSVGFGVYLIVSFANGWLSISSPFAVIVSVAINAVLFLAIGLGYYLLNEREAKIINEKLKERNSN